MRQIELSRGKVALVDDDDFEWLSQLRWFAVKSGAGIWYAGTGKRNIKMHRLILGANPPEKIDHVDRNGLNNQRGNLRFCTVSENCRNKKRRSDNKSGFKGVWKNRRVKKFPSWVSEITINGKNKYLGSFRDPRDAALCYDQAALELFGKFALTNKALGLI